MRSVVSNLLIAGLLAVGSVAHAVTFSFYVSTGDNKIDGHLKEDVREIAGDLFTCPVEIVDSMDDANVVAVLSDKIDVEIALPEGKNAAQGFAIKTIGSRIYVTSQSPEGVMYGIYAFFEEYGAFFQINGTHYPAKKVFETRDMDISRSPVFKYRGLLPWDNFLCGMSGYDLADYKELAKNAARMKLNMLQFHFYPGLVFFTQECDGKKVAPQFVGSPVNLFHRDSAVFGKEHYKDKLFGPDCYIENIDNPYEQAKACQDMFAEALDYARNLGFATCVGFEIIGDACGEGTYFQKPNGTSILDPTDKTNVDLVQKKFETLKKTYPQSDYYWIWQSELKGHTARAVGDTKAEKEFRKEYGHWAGEEYFSGDTEYAYLFREVVRNMKSEDRKRVATGGWTIGHLFPQIDDEFPEDTIFASLNTYHQPQSLERVEKYYKPAQNGRRMWMIDWWEFDGMQWYPQFRLTYQNKMYDWCRDYGVEAVTLLGWKLGGVEHQISYFAVYAWDPTISAEDFYASYSKRFYPDMQEDANEMFLAYDKVDPEVPGSSGFHTQPMCLSVGWAGLYIPLLPLNDESLENHLWRDGIAKTQANLQKLHSFAEMDRRYADMIDKAGASTRWAKIMHNRLESRYYYTQSLMELSKSYLAYDEMAKNGKYEEARKAAQDHAQKAMDNAKKCMSIYANGIWDTNDLGALAQMHKQYYQVIEEYIRELAGESSPYTKVDWQTFRLDESVVVDGWQKRDGTAVVWETQEDGRKVFTVKIDGNKTKYNSVFAYPGEIDLTEAPYIDFYVRTKTDQPVAVMFQSVSSDTYYSFSLVGRQDQYVQLDSVPHGNANDGKWHRVTVDLYSLLKDRVPEASPRIHNLVVGSWNFPVEDIEISFRDIAFGKRNLLD